MMKGVVITRNGGAEVLRYQAVPDPTPGEGEVLIRTEATSVNFADIMLREGRYHAGAQPPVIPGMDVAGHVVAVGSDGGEVGVGDRVVAFVESGSYAEYVVAPSILTWVVANEIDLETAAALPTVGITAYNLLVMAARLQSGETVLVHSAAGGVGTTAVQLAKLLGAGSVIGTVGSEEKAEVACEVGCDYVINYRMTDFAEEANSLTDGRGVDVVLDAVGGNVFERSLACLADFGRLVIYGMASARPGAVSSDQLHPTNRSVLGYSSGSFRRSRPAHLRPAAEAVLEFVREGKLQFLVGARYPLSEAAQAHRLIESRGSVGKILLLPD